MDEGTDTACLRGLSTKSIRIIVRRESVLVDVDGNVFIDYRGDPSRLDFDDRFFRRPRLNQLMLGGWETEFRVSKWTLTPFGDEPVEYARATDPVVAASDGAAPSTGVTQPATSPSPKAAVADHPSADAPDSPDDKAMVDSQIDVAAKTRGDADSEPIANTPEERETVAWQATPDPYPGWDGMAVADISIPLPAGWVVVPDGPSPYFMAGTTSGETIRWAVCDVRTGSLVGKTCELPTRGHDHPKLCPSGRYMQGYVGAAADRRVVVHSFVTGEQVYEASSPNVRTGDAQRDYLALNHALLQVRGGQEDVQFQRVDLRTGRVEATWSSGRSPSELTSMALTPGGRFMLANWNNQFVAYDLSTSQLVGQVDGPDGLSFSEAMAFSIDGAELALLGDESDRSSPTLWCIDWDTGETALLANLQAEVNSLRNNYLLGPALEWFPDKELILYYGRDVIDRRTGKFCYQIPANVYWQNPRRTLGNRSILGMMPGDDPDDRRYRAIPLDRSALEAALQVVRRGGTADDVGLPPLTIPDNANGRVISSIGNTGPVSLASEDRQTFPAQAVTLPMRLAQFQDFGTELRRIEFADPPEPTAVLHFTLNGDDDDERRDMVVRYDLRRGKPSGSIPIRRDFRLAAVSPDGTFALLGLFNEVDGYSRLDVVDLAGQHHIAGWRPFCNETYAEDVSATGQPEARNPMTATWVRFVDNRRVVAVNPAGKLVCWQVPECTVLFTCDDFGRPLALSDDRRYLAGSKSTDLHLLDVRDGVWAGKLEPQERPQTILRAGFAPGNRELVAVLGYQGRRNLVVWDLLRGTPIEQFDVPYHTVSPGWSEHRHPMHRQIGLDFRRNGYVSLDDLYLIDRTSKTVPWQYSLRRGKHVVNGPDEREWFTEFQTANHGQGQVFEYWLTAAALPSDEVLAMIRTAPARGSEHPVGRSILSTTAEDAQLIPAVPSGGN